MLTYELIQGGYRIYEDRELRLDQPGDPRKQCVRPMVLAPFNSPHEAALHAEQAILDMTLALELTTNTDLS